MSEYLKSKPEYCKTCLRPLDDEYINNLRDKLKYVFQNDLLEETTNEINKIVNEIITDRKEVQNNHVETNKINNLIKHLNLESLKIKELLKDKMNSK